MKIRLILVLLLLCFFVVSCDSKKTPEPTEPTPAPVLSSDTTLQIESIAGKTLGEGSTLVLTDSEWKSLQTNLNSSVVYQVAEKATVETSISTATNEISFTVTAEDGTKNTYVVKVSVLSNNVTFTLTSISGINVFNNEIFISASKWDELKNADLKEKSVYTLAPKATLSVSVDAVKNEISYLVRAEDGTTKTYVVKVSLYSNDTSINFTTIYGKEVIDNAILLTASEWKEFVNAYPKINAEYTIAETSQLKISFDEINREIKFIVTAEDGTIAETIAKINIISSDASIKICEINGSEVVNNVVKITAEEWTTLKELDLKEVSIFEIHEKAIVEVSLNEQKKEIKYLVTAEDGTKNTVVVSVSVIEDIQNTNVVLMQNAGSSVAKSYWFAEYTETGINIRVDVVDDTIYTSNVDCGMNDNIEFIIGLRSKCYYLSTETDYKVLVDAKGNYFFQKAANLTNFGGSLQVDGPNFVRSVEKVDYSTGSGYRVNVYIAYSLLGTTKAEAYGNLTICPAMRNTNTTASNWVYFTELDCAWARSYTYVGIEDDGTFVNNVAKYYNNVDYLFIGDSWIDPYFWSSFDVDFADYNAINIGIGGTKGEDWVARLDIIKKFNPKNLIFRIGTNDINVTGQSGTSAGNEIVEIMKMFHEELPNMHIYFLSIDPCIGHIYNWTNGNDAVANSIVEEFAKTVDYVTYQDFTEQLLDENGHVLATMFRADSCHLSSTGYMAYVKTMYEMLGLTWNEGNTFGDSGKFAHSLGFSSEAGNTSTNNDWGEQQTHFVDFSSNEFYAEFEITALNVLLSDGYPKFGLRLTSGSTSLSLYIDGYAGLSGNVVGAVWRHEHYDYDWTNAVSSPAIDGLNYTSGAYTKLGVLRTNGMIYYFVNDVCVLQFADSFDSVETAVGAFTFNTVVKIKNGYVSAETSVIAEKLAQVQQ